MAEYLGFEIVGTASNGDEALNLFNLKKPDLMLLDINIPRKTGIEVLEEIIQNYPDAMVIMLTAVSDIESIQKCIKLGATYFIRKDTPVPQMVKLIRKSLAIYEAKKAELEVYKYDYIAMSMEIDDDESLCPSEIVHSTKWG